MSVLASGLTSLQEVGVDESLASKAREAVSRLLLPKRFNGGVVEKYFKKALRSGAWKFLKRECRALLLVLKRWSREVKSPVLKSLLKHVFLNIELSTLKGRAVYYGVVLALKKGLLELLNKASNLLALGIFYLNNPPIYRIYG